MFSNRNILFVIFIIVAKKDEEVINVNIGPFILPITIFVSTLVFSIAFYLGVTNMQIEFENGVAPTVLGESNTGNNDAPTIIEDGEPTPAPTLSGNTTIDDDAIKGDMSSAKVAVVEFSDFNCSFCQRHHSSTYGQLVEEFVNSGDVVLVYRDFAGVGGQTTERAAAAAECVREQIGDDGYFDLLQDIYASSSTKDESLVQSLAADINGVNEGELSDCIDNDTYISEVNGDREDAISIGINGTPGFVVGTLNEDGTVEGEQVSGAQPFDVFKSTIEKYL